MSLRALEARGCRERLGYLCLFHVRQSFNLCNGCVVQLRRQVVGEHIACSHLIQEHILAFREVHEQVDGERERKSRQEQQNGKSYERPLLVTDSGFHQGAQRLHGAPPTRKARITTRWLWPLARGRMPRHPPRTYPRGQAPARRARHRLRSRAPGFRVPRFARRA